MGFEIEHIKAHIIRLEGIVRLRGLGCFERKHFHSCVHSRSIFFRAEQDFFFFCFTFVGQLYHLHI